MRIEGKWILDDDGITRPYLPVKIPDVDGTPEFAWFLVDSGADRTVFTASLLRTLRLPLITPDTTGLVGVGGQTGFVLVKAVLEFTTTSGTPIRVRGEFAGFSDPSAMDVNILGRDVLNNFDVILSWNRQEVLLVGAESVSDRLTTEATRDVRGNGDSFPPLIGLQ